ncbi:MAG: preprotein translocase subunit SecE [Clostridia bacterium]|nr:preprotein translocase subunit SecE [Clostridia bacterium]
MGRVFGATLTYTAIFTAAVIGGIASVVVCIAGVLVKDAVECKETGRLPILKRVVKFLREYKSELKKVVWPGPRSVVKNTLVVLGFCGIALLLIWLVDLGLRELFELCFKTN